MDDQSMPDGRSPDRPAGAPLDYLLSSPAGSSLPAGPLWPKSATVAFTREVAYNDPAWAARPGPFILSCRHVRDGSTILDVCWKGPVDKPIPFTWEALRGFGYNEPPASLDCFPWPLEKVKDEPARCTSWYRRTDV